jgi:hypothetical protein
MFWVRSWRGNMEGRDVEMLQIYTNFDPSYGALWCRGVRRDVEGHSRRGNMEHKDGSTFINL